MHIYRGMKVRVKEELRHMAYQNSEIGVFITESMAQNAGQIVTIERVLQGSGKRFKIKEDEGRWVYDVSMVELISMDKHDAITLLIRGEISEETYKELSEHV